MSVIEINMSQGALITPPEVVDTYINFFRGSKLIIIQLAQDQQYRGRK